MTRPRFAQLMLLVVTVVGGGLVTSCKHYYLDQNNSHSGEKDSEGPVTGDDLERVVEYAQREPIAKQVCEDSDYKLHFTVDYAPDPTITQQVEDLLSGMTLADKILEMGGTDPMGGSNLGDIFRQPDNKDKKFRGLQFRDGPRGLNLAAELQPGHNGFATAFPVSMARGATFDLNLEYRIGQAQGDETLASRNTMMLAPTVNILRHPAWGRAQETYGEDPYLLGRMGSAYTIGVQEYIPACVKHYIANNVENQRASVNSVLDEQTLREIYGRAYEMIIKDSGVSSVMAAYNPVNGDKSTENYHILQEVLRDDFGFEGFVLSDWWAMSNGNSTTQLPAAYQSVAIAGIQSGMDMELPWALNYGSEHIETLINNQQLSEGDINRSVRRILQQKMRFNILDKSVQNIGLKQPTVGWDPATSSITNYQKHIDLAEEAALKSAVLLKNDGHTLPIDRNSVSTVAVLGANVDFTLDSISFSDQINYATDVVTGDMGSSRVFSDPEKSVSPFAGIAAAAGAGINVISGTSAADAANADFVVVVAGLNAADEGEEYTGAGDRSSFALDGKIAATPQNDLIAAVAQSGKPMAVVLIGGSVIDTPWLGQVPAVLMAWYPGMVGGKAIGKLLFGDVSPGGKLPLSWPKSWSDEPEFNLGTGTVDMGYFVGYRYFENANIAPLYPFGHGLSYTEFEYLNLEVPCSSVTEGGVVEVKVDVYNKGTLKADEVAFLFISYPESSDPRKQVKQLKGFYRVSLEPAQAKQITFPLRINDLRFFDQAANNWIIEKGTVDVMVGSSAGNILLTDQITVK